MISSVATSSLFGSGYANSMAKVTSVQAVRRGAVGRTEQVEDTQTGDSFAAQSAAAAISAQHSFSVASPVSAGSAFNVQLLNQDEAANDLGEENTEAQAEENGQSATGQSASFDDFTDEEKEQIEELKQEDQRVRQHEQAHANAGGPYAGAPKYQTESGPDGQQYAVSGEVDIDTSPVNNNPEATIAKMEVVKRAALAPGEPSAQDRKVAATAERVIAESRQEIAAQRTEEQQQSRKEQTDKATISESSKESVSDNNESVVGAVSQSVAALFEQASNAYNRLSSASQDQNNKHGVYHDSIKSFSLAV